MAKETESEGTILIGHISDTHLRDTQYATSRRGMDFFTAARAAIEVAAPKVDMFVHSGDIFDRPRPSPRVIQQLMELDALLQEHEKVMLAVTGNHDWCDPTWLRTLFPKRGCWHCGNLMGNPGPERLLEGEYGIIPLDGRTTQYKGVTFTGVTQRNAPAFRRDIVDIENQIREADVVLFHALVTGISPLYVGEKDPLDAKELPLSKKTLAWLLGDIHIQGYIDRERPGGGTTLIGYPGSTEVCNRAEAKEKSVPVVAVTPGKKAQVSTYIPIPTRPFIDGKVTTDEEEDVLIERVKAVAKLHPVVDVDFERTRTGVIGRLHSLLDAQRAVVRCHPLPVERVNQQRAEDDGEEDLTMDYFISRRFEERADLADVAMDLFHRGETDANNVIMAWVDKRLEAIDVREEEEAVA